MSERQTELMRTAGQQHSLAQQVELGPTEHLAFDQFDPVDVPLNGTRAPVDGESGLHSQPIAVEIAAEAAQFRRTCGLKINGLLQQSIDRAESRVAHGQGP